MSPIEDIQHFLLVYNVSGGEALVEEFGIDYEGALEAYAEREREYRDRGNSQDVDIVLVGADSLETVKRTHSSYFEFRSGSGFDQYMPA